MLPLLLAISIGVSTKLAHSEPSRYFVVVDKSGAFAEPIEQSIEWEHQRSVLQALGQYVQENLRAGQHPDVNLATYQAAVDAFIAAGGKDAYLARLRPVLRENAPAFKEPTRLFVRVELPKEIDPGASGDAILAGLKPYLLGERRIAVDGADSAPLRGAADRARRSRRSHALDRHPKRSSTGRRIWPSTISPSGSATR